MVEQILGWLKQAGGPGKVRPIGRWKIWEVAYLWAVAGNLRRMAPLERREVAGSRRNDAPWTERERKRYPDSHLPASLMCVFLLQVHKIRKHHRFFSILLEQICLQ